MSSKTSLLSAFRSMPGILQLFTAGAFLFILFLLNAVVPGMPFTVSGEEISHEQAWKSGYAIFYVIPGIFMPIAGFLLLKRWRYSRHFYLLNILFIFTVPYLYFEDSFSYVVTGLNLLTWAALGIYLFFNKSVKEYFRENSAN